MAEDAEELTPEQLVAALVDGKGCVVEGDPMPSWRALIGLRREDVPRGPATQVGLRLQSIEAGFPVKVQFAGVAMTPDEAREFAKGLSSAAEAAEVHDRSRDATTEEEG